jgi:hypothetical protein
MRHCVHCAIGNKGKRQFTYQLFSWILEIKTKILVLNFFNLLDTLELVSGDCDVRTQKMNYFFWIKVIISVFIFLMLQTALKISACFTFCFCFYYRFLNNSSHRVYIQATEWLIYNSLVIIWKQSIILRLKEHLILFIRGFQ